MPSASDRLFLDRLAELLGADAIHRRLGERRFFAEDALGSRGLPPEPALPIAVARPADAESVARLLALASEAGVPVIPYGAGTGLMGGARSLHPGLVLDLERLNQIDVRPDDRLVWAGAGTVLEDVDVALRAHNLCLGHDPWTFPVATVGGVLSTNGLGYKGGRYGGAGDQAIAIEVALADGTLLRTRAVRRHATGPDLARLFIGAQGVLGVITAAALEAFPVPESEAFAAYTFPAFEAGFAAINQIAALGLRPSLLDYGEEHASPWPELSSRIEEPPVLYLGFEGYREEVEAAAARAAAIVSAEGSVRLPDSEVKAFWQQRHVVAERFRRGNRNRRRRGRWNAGLATDYIHVALPPSQVLAFRQHCHDLAASERFGLLECGLWTVPDYFSAILALPESDGGHERLGPIADALLETCQDLGGSMEYVHGAGLRLAHLMPREHGPALDLLRRLKSTLDPANILNPGKLGL
jgi:alkyldihydroxyacetonephosphate synthase